MKAEYNRYHNRGICTVRRATQCGSPAAISITWELARNRDSWIPLPNLLNQELREQARQCVCVCVCFKKPPGDSNLTKFLKVLPKGGAEESVTCSTGGGDYVVHRITMEKM